MLRIANERRVPVVPRGSGTNLSAGTVPHHGGIVLVLTRMNKMKEVSDAELVASLRAGRPHDRAGAGGGREGPPVPARPGQPDRRDRSAGTSRSAQAACAR